MLHFIGWLYAFALSAVFSAGISLAPISVAWSSFWVYVTFAICLIPGYIAAWITVVALFALMGVLGFGAALGGVTAMNAFSKGNLRGRR